MAERQWYYVRGERQVGPVPQEKMEEMLSEGHLGAETFVWSDPMSNWSPAGEVHSLQDCFTEDHANRLDSHQTNSVVPCAVAEPQVQTQVATQTAPPPQTQQQVQQETGAGQVGVNSLLSGEQLAMSIPNVIPSSRTSRRPVSTEARPWVRYWARYIDIFLFSVVAGVVLGIAAPALLEQPDLVLGMGILLAWVFVEAIFLSGTGTTPGKWILNTKVRISTGRKLTFTQALNRSFSVWWRGMGTGLPIVILVTLILGYNKLKKEGITSWDRDGQFVVEHGRIGVLRVLLAMLLIVAFIALIVMEQAASMPAAQ